MFLLNKEIVILGDVHGNFKELKYILEDWIQPKPKLAILCGDIGLFWPRSLPEHNKIFSDIDMKILFIDGNHDRHDIWQTENSPIIDSLKASGKYYMPRGSIERIMNQNFLFLGGALSIDKLFRLPYISWWPEEELSQKDYEKIDKNVPIDVVISHDIPNSFKFKQLDRFEKQDEQTRRILDIILHEKKPKEWFFGHHHIQTSGRFEHDNGLITDWVGLTDIPSFRPGEDYLKNFKREYSEKQMWQE